MASDDRPATAVDGLIATTSVANPGVIRDASVAAAASCPVGEASAVNAAVARELSGRSSSPAEYEEPYH